jgi:hypothetical protein
MKKLKFQTLKDEGNARFNEEYEYFEENYLHGNSLINIKHIRCGTIFEITGLRHLRSKYGGCPICRIIGERNPIWNPDREEVTLRRMM